MPLECYAKKWKNKVQSGLQDRADARNYYVDAKFRLNIHFNSATYCGECMPTRHRREKPISGWLLEELLSVMRVHGTPHTHQLMLIQPGSMHLLLASALLIINPFLHTSSELKNSLTVSLQTSRQRAGCEGF